MVHIRARARRRLRNSPISKPCADERAGLRDLPRLRGVELHQLGRRDFCSRAGRYKLFDLPQWHDGNRQNHAAAYSDGTVQCGNCHVNTAASFVTYTMKHSAVSASRCDSCHNGSTRQKERPARKARRRTPVMSRPAVATASPATPARQRVSPVGREQNTSTPTDTNCSSCHNGTTALGMTTPPHVPVTGVQCGNCHANTAASFVTYTMNHSAVSASRCDACHNGSYTSEGTKGAQGTASYAGHVATAGRDCITCHASAATSFTSWAGGVYVHQPSDTNCSSCHNGATATGNTMPPHIPVRHPMQHMPYQHGAEFHHLHDEPSGGERQPVRRLPQRLLCIAGDQGRVRDRVISRPCGDQRPGLPHLPCRSSGGLHQLGRRRPTPSAKRHELLELPQRHHRDRQYDAAAHPGDRRPVQQLPRQHRGELYHLHDEPPGGERQPVRHLPQRILCVPGDQGRAGNRVISGPCGDGRLDCATCHAGAATTFTSWAGATYVHQPSDTNCTNCHNGLTAPA